MTSTQPSQIQKLPGFTERLNYKPAKTSILQRSSFPNALDSNDVEDDYVGFIQTKREIIMMQVMNSIAEKPDWDRKVFDETITSKWRQEISNSGQDVSSKMMDWIIKEMQWKADLYQKRGILPIFDVGVVCSEKAIEPELQQALRKAVAPLENIPDAEKDYHPNSDMKVVDLVHPSLFPVVYGRTQILSDRLITVDNCLNSIGLGETLSIPPEDEAQLRSSNHWHHEPRPTFSRKFQWLPCDVDFTDENGCRIVSYINNLHPIDHRPLYSVVEQVIAKAIPLWDESLIVRRRWQDERIPFKGVEYLDRNTPEPEWEEDLDGDEYQELRDAWEESLQIIIPEPGEFCPPRDDEGDAVNLRDEFREKGFQVIVKLANIELTPEKPDYEGGSWHIEGQLNERICATAIYYYDVENITESRLAFRQRASRIDDLDYPQSQHMFLQQVYGFGPDVDGNGDTQVTQEVGSVLCREGRLITFPNILQHRVAPFGLADRSRPGHRKILALFLIDPYRRIISSANVPPQQKAWAKEREATIRTVLSERLPVELQQIVSRDIPSCSMTLDEAKEYRLELMEERSIHGEKHNGLFEIGDFALCEH